MFLDPACPIFPLLPYLLEFNGTAASDWAAREMDSINSTLPVALVLTIGSLLLLLTGEYLSRLALALCGALVVFVLSLWGSSSLLPALSPSPEASCLVLMVVPLVMGVLGGLLPLRFPRMAFASAGIAAGGASGQLLYLLVLHNVSMGTSLLHHDLFYFILLLTLAAAGGLLMALFGESLMIIATAVLGSVGLVPALGMLVFSRIDARFLWVTDVSVANEHRNSPFVYGQALFILLYLPFGVLVQRRLRCKGSLVSERSQPYVVFDDRGHRSCSSAA